MKCWCTMPMPRAMASPGLWNETCSPSTAMVPSSGFCMPYRIFIRVDLPAPFSPTRAWTVPRRTVMSMSWLATTPGNRLVMPRSSTAWGLLDALMTHSPWQERRAEAMEAVGAKKVPRPADATRVAPPNRWPPGNRWRTVCVRLRRRAVEGRTRNRGPGEQPKQLPPGPDRRDGSGRGLDLDRAVDDLLLRLVELGLDVREVVTRGGQRDAPLAREYVWTPVSGLPSLTDLTRS